MVNNHLSEIKALLLPTEFDPDNLFLKHQLSCRLLVIVISDDHLRFRSFRFFPSSNKNVNIASIQHLDDADATSKL